MVHRNWSEPSDALWETGSLLTLECKSSWRETEGQIKLRPLQLKMKLTGGHSRSLCSDVQTQCNTTKKQGI